MNHKKWVIYYLEELLNKKQTVKFESHLDACPFCQNYIKNYQSLNKIISKRPSEKIRVNNFDKAEFISRITNISRAEQKTGFNFMPQLRWALVSALIIAGILLYFNIKQPITVLSSKGEVFIQQAKQTRLLQNDEKISQNHIITTGRDSECYLNFGNNIIYLGNNTQVLVEEMSKRVTGYIIKLDIKRGFLLSNINDKKSISKMIVKAGKTTTLVKGTIFMVDRTDVKKQTIAVLKGEISVQKNGEEYSLSSKKKLVVDNLNKVSENAMNYQDEHKFSKILRFNLYFDEKWRQELRNYKGIRIVEDQQNFYIIGIKGKIICLDKNTGNIAWEVKVGPEIKATPVLHKQCLYITSSDGYIYCVSNEEIKWRKKLGPFVYSSPIIDRDRLFLANTLGFIYAVDLDTKQILWQRKLDSDIFSTPSIQNNKLYIGSMAGKLYCLDQATGNIVWIRELEGGLIDSTPVLYGNTLFIGTRPGKVYSISSINGKQNWEKQVKGEINTSLTLKEDIIYVKSEKLYAFNVKGQNLWSRKIASGVNIYMQNDKILLESSHKISYIDFEKGQLKKYYTKDQSMNIISFNNRVFMYNQKYIKLIKGGTTL